MYKKAQNNWDGSQASYVIRLADNAFIPMDPNNRDYAEYLAWLAEGNVPEEPQE